MADELLGFLNLSITSAVYAAVIRVSTLIYDWYMADEGDETVEDSVIPLFQGLKYVFGVRNIDLPSGNQDGLAGIVQGETNYSNILKD